GTTRSPLVAPTPEVCNHTLRGTGFSHPEAGGLEVHEPRPPPPGPVQTRDPGSSGRGRRRETRALHVRCPQDDPAGLRERPVRAPPLVPAAVARRGPGRFPRGSIEPGSGDAGTAPGANRAGRRRPVP